MHNSLAQEKIVRSMIQSQPGGLEHRFLENPAVDPLTGAGAGIRGRGPWCRPRIRRGDVEGGRFDGVERVAIESGEQSIGSSVLRVEVSDARAEGAGAAVVSIR
ncbi:hypothetical protein [Rothia koreensis]|uniref:hypothetical protein n=2 Tax=Rothia koreensis TaxID=592378 RepID=UPI001EE7C5CC|nr:hypothetical protein [Rothia koreensis]